MRARRYIWSRRIKRNEVTYMRGDAHRSPFEKRARFPCGICRNDSIILAAKYAWWLFVYLLSGPHGTEGRIRKARGFRETWRHGKNADLPLLTSSLLGVAVVAAAAAEFADKPIIAFIIAPLRPTAASSSSRMLAGEHLSIASRVLFCASACT